MNTEIFQIIAALRKNGGKFIDDHRHGENVEEVIEDAIVFVGLSGKVHVCPVYKNTRFCLNKLYLKDGVVHLSTSSVGGLVNNMGVSAQEAADHYNSLRIPESTSKILKVVNLEPTRPVLGEVFEEMRADADGAFLTDYITKMHEFFQVDFESSLLLEQDESAATWDDVLLKVGLSREGMEKFIRDELRELNIDPRDPSLIVAEYVLIHSNDAALREKAAKLKGERLAAA